MYQGMVCKARGQDAQVYARPPSLCPLQVVNPQGDSSMLFLWAEPERAPWVKARPPDAHRQSALPGLAPGGGPWCFHTGRGTLSLMSQIHEVFETPLSGPSPTLRDPTRSNHWIPGTHKPHHHVKVMILWSGGAKREKVLEAEVS